MSFQAASNQNCGWRADLAVGIDDADVRELAGQVPVAAHLPVAALEVPQRPVILRQPILCSRQIFQLLLQCLCCSIKMCTSSLKI